MISIIICSRTSTLSDNVVMNINNTVGTEYELIVIDNSSNKYNIFQAYNEGVIKSRGDILCFMHDDIVFRSLDWGEIVCEILRDQRIGVVGVVGCQFLSNKVIPWTNMGHRIGRIIQGYVNSNGEYNTYIDGPEMNRKILPGVVVDGLWMCIRKNTFNEISFDDKIYSGFHCYDIDVCMQILFAGMQVVVAGDILIEHQSCGCVTQIYFEQLNLFVKKWNFFLPVSRGLKLGKLGTWLYQIYKDLKMLL